MNTHDLSLVMSGAILLGYLVAAVFFWRFWRQVRDRLFIFFAAAFCIMAVERVILLWSSTASSHLPQLYLTRLLAFLLIIQGIWEKNRAARE